jgi:hypothetical protein
MKITSYLGIITMITELTRVVKGVYIYSNTSIVFDSNPYLLANNDLTLYFTNNDARFASRVVSVSGNTAVIDFSNPQYNNTGVAAKTPNYGSGLTGPQDTFTFSFTNYPSAILQAFSTGGSSNVVIQVSTNQSNWINVATLAVTTANSNTNYTTVTAPWPYGRLNIIDIAAGNSIAVNKAT